MSIVGSPSAWEDLLEQILPDLLDLVIDTWPNVKGPLRDTREDTVTEALCRALKQNRTLRELPVYVITQLVELEPADEEDMGRLDIAFLPTGIQGPPDESIYFCLECKLLNVFNGENVRRKGSEYVKFGILRFVTGQYAKAVKHGGMVGYVLDGDLPSALTNVEANIRKHYQLLQMEEPGILHQSSILSHLPTARESLHHRNGEAHPFRVHHLFFKADSLFE